MDLSSLSVPATPLPEDGQITQSTGANAAELEEPQCIATGACIDDMSATALTSSSNFSANSIANKSFVDGSSKVASRASLELMNNSNKAPAEEMAHSKDWIFIVIIFICVLITQAVAYFATPLQTLVDRKYVLNILALYTMVVQWVVFIHAGGFFGNERTEKYYDLTGSITYLSTVAISLFFVRERLTARQIVLSICVAIWSARLGWFLFSRIHNNNGIDSRFTKIKACRPRFMMAWTLQGAWVFLTMLPVLMVNQSYENVSFGFFDYSGIVLWLFGFIFEVVADFQKSAFRKLAENRDKFIHTGLWSISRHPNYFGEILLWVGVAVCAFSGLSARPRALFVFLSPFFVAFLLIFVSGIPMLEEKADQKFGEDVNYQRYKKNTPVLIPFIRRTSNEL